jgi:hypothetical protein
MPDWLLTSTITTTRAKWCPLSGHVHTKRKKRSFGVSSGHNGITEHT